MNLLNWFAHKTTPTDDASDEKYRKAMEISAEVVEQMRERTASPDPFRAVMADMFLQNHDIAVIADAYEMMQEVNIYKGAPK